MADFRFKFKELDANGQPTGLFSTKARITDTMLVLGTDEIPLHQVVGAFARAHNAVVRWHTDGRVTTHLAFRVTRGGQKKVLRLINQACSHACAMQHRDDLDLQGKADMFRNWTCPKCHSTVDLSGREETPQTWCPYCDALFTLAGDAPYDEAKFSCCEHCKLYSQPKVFTVFYFWHAIFVYGLRYRVMHMCNVCMRKEAWNMLLLNFLFVVGTIPSLYQLIRAYLGGSKLSARFWQLDSANAAVHKRDYQKASELYHRILEKHPHSAGVFYNLGQAQIKARNFSHAVSALTASLNACINYEPAYVALADLLASKGTQVDLEHVKQRFLGVDYEPPQAPSIADPA